MLVKSDSHMKIEKKKGLWVMYLWFLSLQLIVFGIGLSNLINAFRAQGQDLHRTAHK